MMFTSESLMARRTTSFRPIAEYRESSRRSGGSGGGALTYTVGGTIFGLTGDGSSSLSGARHSRQYGVTDQRHASFSSPSFRKLIAGSSVDSITRHI